ncbi:class I SAM-dependent methyltransferase [Halomonas sp. EGI 63088]|uniref:Class I SAM-dependent methyltransferase n=1 Tax=Halomonas flagellata TaxID=2920385 RepID=A0ABS9S0J7_9GAMM|nr:class I SAM-dependent methyltransferase [Halomonas flagellata]MCH4565530.1 class I SAM-dependent methyltransferase [Halomonas flagellata]
MAYLIDFVKTNWNKLIMNTPVTAINPEDIPKSYYDFSKYNSKQRMLTYWYQLSMIHECHPRLVLEVGVGTGLVTAYLRHDGVHVATFDINSQLNPDHVGSILSLPEGLPLGLFDLVLCSRVLHHIPFGDMEKALCNLSALTKRYCLITLPVNDFRIYLMARITSSSISTLSLPLPLILKKVLVRMSGRGCDSGVWQINSSHETSENKVVGVIARRFHIIKMFRMPEDQSHMMFLLEKK